LYAKDTRFVYELIQNAEDNKYTITKDPPFLRFALYKDRIEVDSNENGFSVHDIRAICAIGESTKMNVPGYIGEKGIGFKSVFKVAYKVHIQSEPYSFAFSHRRDSDDNGLGLVTPMNEPFRPIPEDVRTRMTLHLLETCDRKELGEDLLKLPDTLLLFLAKLKKLTIRVELPGDSLQVRQYSLSSSGSRATIQKAMTTALSEVSQESSQVYLIKHRLVSDMPPDGARKDITNAKVVLAFPLGVRDEPIVEEQYVFAFLPVRPVGFKVCVESHFNSNFNKANSIPTVPHPVRLYYSSREDVFDNKWNNHLLKEVAETFIDSIDVLLSHPSLKHHWVQYIPTERLADEFWGRLQLQIFQALKSRTKFFSKANARLMAPHQLRMVPNQYRDADGEPLLRDLSFEKSAYISEDYDRGKDVPILKKLGASTLSIPGFLARVKQDLLLSDSRIQKTPHLAIDWHTRVSDQLIEAIKHDYQNFEFLGKLPIVLLNNGRWVLPFKASIFWPTSGGIEIPADLGLGLVDTNILQNESRRKLFAALGITECKPKTIFPLIEQQYKSSYKTFEKSLAHIKFMFWHQLELPYNGLQVWLASNNGDHWFRPTDEQQGWIYCPSSEGEYTATSIFGAFVPEDLSNRMHFVNTKYYDKLEQYRLRNDQTGVQWFRRYFRIEDNVKLSLREHMDNTSYEFDYIIEHHPESLLGVLQANWIQYQEREEWDNAVKSAQVPILNSEQRRRLDSTYLPVPKLRAIVKRLCLEVGFGFIQELQDITDISSIKWSFLKRFGVAMEDDVAFWLALLAQARAQKEIQTKVVFEIYKNLQKFTSEEDVAKIR
jgi:hypothetical protein